MKNHVRKILSITLLISSTLLLDSCKINKSKTAEQRITSNEKTWNRFETAEYLLKYPPGWILNQSGKEGTQFYVYPDTKITDNNVNVSMSIYSLSELGGISLSELSKINESRITAPNSGLALVSSELVRSLNGGSHCMVITGDQDETTYKWKQMYWIDGSRSYELTYSSTEACFDRYDDVVNKIMLSFTIKH